MITLRRTHWHSLYFRLASVLALVWLLDAASPLRAGELGDTIRPLIDEHRGKVAVAVKHLKTGEEFRFHADEPMPTASLIKLAVMIEVHEQVREGKVRLEDTVTLTDADKVPGSGILTTHFSTGATFPLRDAVRLMIVYSDNRATNLVLDKIGIGSTAARMEAWGFPNTKIHAKVFRRDTSIFPDRSEKFGLGSTTAAEMIGLVEAIGVARPESVKGERARSTRPSPTEGVPHIPEADRAAMLDHLKRCDDKDKFPRLLPPRTVIAHKTGSVEKVRTDAGIIYSPSGPIALVVLTSDNEDTSWRTENAGNVLCAKIARAVYDHFNPAKPSGNQSECVARP